MTIIPPTPEVITEESPSPNESSFGEKMSSRFSKKKITVIAFLVIAALGIISFLFRSTSGAPSDSKTSVLLTSLEDGEIDYVQVGSSKSLEKILNSAVQTRLEEISQIRVLSGESFSFRNYVSLPNGDLAVSYTNKEKRGLTILKANSELPIELIEPDDHYLSTAFSSIQARFFVTVAEGNRIRCLSIDLEGNQIQLGRGYCKLLTSDLVLVVDEDDDTNKVTILTIDVKGAEIGEVEVELSDFNTTPSGDMYYGYSENGAGDSLLTVLKSDGLQIWKASSESLATSLSEVLNTGLVVAVDEGQEIEKLILITAKSDTGIVSTIAEGEKVSTFSSTDGKLLFTSTASQDAEFNDWKVFGVNSEDEPIGRDFYVGGLTNLYFVPESQTILGWNANSNELLFGTEEGSLTYLSDFDNPISQIFIMQTQVYLLSGDELWRIDESQQDLVKIEDNIAIVTQVANGASNVFVYQDDNENYRLVQLIEGELVDIAEDNFIDGLIESGSSKLYYSTGDPDRSNLDLYSIDLANDPVKQRSKIGKRLASDSIVLPEFSVDEVFLAERYGTESFANIDRRRRACKDEGLQILESGDSATFDVIPPNGSYFCLFVSEKDSGFYGFGLEVTSESDLEIEVSQDGDVLYAVDDQVNSSGGIVSYDPSIVNMSLSTGTYRVHLFPHESNADSGSPSVLFRGNQDYVESETFPSSPTQNSTSGCDIIVNPDDTTNFEVDQYSKEICFIRDPSTEQEITIQILGVSDGSWLDVRLDCSSFSQTEYSSPIYYYIDAGKGIDRCEIGEIYPSDGSYGEVSVSANGVDMGD